MSSVRKIYSSLQKQLAEFQRSTFDNAVSYIQVNAGLQFHNAVQYLLNVTKANADSFKLKSWQIEYFSNRPDVRKASEDFAYTKRVEREQFIGTYQNGQAHQKGRFDCMYMLVNQLKFTLAEAKKVFKVLDTLAEITGSEAPLLRDYISIEMPLLLNNIETLMTANDWSAHVAHNYILENLPEDDESHWLMTRLLVSPAMFSYLNKYALVEGAAKNMIKNMQWTKFIEESQTRNREARCEVAEKCIKHLKEDAYDSMELLAILDAQFLASPDDQEKLEALETSIAIDQYSCYSTPDVDFHNAFLRADTMRYHLGFFTHSIEECAVSDNKTTFGSLFNSLLTTLVSNCSSDQFLSMAALGLLVPVAYNTFEALSGSEMDTPLRLSM
jgi:hypothetical protein